ncbi:hypothetical protein BSKO_01823 [Bryopsis sp. KO-2023]|nr:hypothetical protein BSKO_01823 [Bryopsis sp. KO-2023]
MASANNNFKSSDEYRRQKELEEARKAGIAPAEVDEDGHEINPHIPQYMSNAPWYLNNDKPSLKHQKNWKGKLQDSRQWYDRGTKTFQANKWRKGACNNCGAMTHATKECMERPRKRGAKLTSKHIAPDEKIQNVALETWDSKRDRWNGYEAAEFAKVVDRYEKVEALRREAKKKQEVERRYKQKEGIPDDEDKIDDAEDTGFGEVKKRVRTTAGGASGSVRNLRIREDTAKYLLNLDLNSSYYDPKSRSMREDPLPQQPMSDKSFAGDNFVRHTGDYQGWQDLNMHAIVAQQKGMDINMQAVPSQVELLYRQFKDKKEKLQKQTKEQVMEKYGQLAEEAPEDVSSLKQSEHYVEYDRFGRVIIGQVTKARSRYEEDVLVNNHTTVWGSWWHEGQWGYQCCHQSVRNSYCTGEKGQQLHKELTARKQAPPPAEIQGDGEPASANGAVHGSREDESEERGMAKESKATTLTSYNPDQEVWGGGDTEASLDRSKVEAALKKMEADERNAESDERKRSYHSISANKCDVTKEEMEAYRIKKARTDDPMAAIEKGKATKGYEYV